MRNLAGVFFGSVSIWKKGNWIIGVINPTDISASHVFHQPSSHEIDCIIYFL